MNCFRISKYNPIYRKQGSYMKDEWTSISDIGKLFNGKIFTSEEYKAIESSYISCIHTIILEANIKKCTIKNFENYSETAWENNQIIYGNQIVLFIIDCLRENCWGKLQGSNFYIHFGYDYYVYIGTLLDLGQIISITSKNGLFCENMVSPYI